MKKAIPVIIAIVLILGIGGVYGAKIAIEKFSYSQERYDLNTYFEVTDDSEAAVVLQNKFMDFKAKKFDGVCYFDLECTKQNFNDRFYVDDTEGLLIYTEADGSTVSHIGESGYEKNGESTATDYIPARYDGDTLYIACDYIKKFTNYEYTLYDEPSRLVIYTEWNSRDVAYASKDTAIRYRGGIKSPILEDLSKGDKVIVLDQMDEWSEVASLDGLIGYVENKRLEGNETEDPIPVTDYTAPEAEYQTMDGKVNMAWHNVAGAAGNDTLSSYIAQTKDVNVISPTWFGLSDNSGGISDIGSDAYVETAHESGMQVWALVSNFVSADVDTYAVLSTTTTRTALIDNLINAAMNYGVDGINVDFEDLSMETGPHFVQFIRELSVRCHQNGLVLSVDNYVDIGNTDYYDRAEQGVYADYVVIMGYDEHTAGSDTAGSVASIDYVTESLDNTTEKVPAERVINGIPFYTRLWETTGTDVSSQAVGMEMAQQWVSDHGITTAWDETTCQNYGEVQSGDTVYQVWLEDAESIEVKLSVMDTYGCGGVAEWCLGFETPDVWDVISEYVNR